MKVQIIACIQEIRINLLLFIIKSLLISKVAEDWGMAEHWYTHPNKAKPKVEFLLHRIYLHFYLIILDKLTG